ncbi:MAG: 30S ribosomal protein S8e [Nanoarchaeota archaeon]
MYTNKKRVEKRTYADRREYMVMAVSRRRKKLREMGKVPTLPPIGERKIKVMRTKGAGIKNRIMAATIVNVIDPSTKHALKATMKYVAENPANRHYVRRNALTRGAIVETDKGRVKITSRPAQDGCVNGVLVK